MKAGTFAISWGRYGGFYLHRRRLCLGWFAFTLLKVEVDDLMRAYVEVIEGDNEGRVAQRTERHSYPDGETRTRVEAEGRDPVAPDSRGAEVAGSSPAASTDLDGRDLQVRGAGSAMSCNESTPDQAATRGELHNRPAIEPVIEGEER